MGKTRFKGHDDRFANGYRLITQAERYHVNIYGIFFNNNKGIDRLNSYFAKFAPMMLATFESPVLYFGSVNKSQCGKVIFEKVHDQENYFPIGTTITSKTVSLKSDFDKYITDTIYKIVDHEMCLIDGTGGVTKVLIPIIFGYMSGSNIVKFNDIDDIHQEQVLYQYLRSSKHSFKPTDIEEMIKLYMTSKSYKYIE